MNEIKKCSISGISFTMEVDAYKTLLDYLETLKRTYGSGKDGNEIIADIEARIAELILSTQDSEKTVERPLIVNIIAQLGSAEDISEESSTDEKKPTEPRIPRRMYRDMENARLGGVCAGIAKYCDIDPAWIRLAVFAPLLLVFTSAIPGVGWLINFGSSLFGAIFLSYFVMWFAVPAARTPRQKLEMNGEKITVQSIREEASSNNDIDNTARPVIANTVTVFGKVLAVLLKVFAAIIIFGLMTVAMGLIIGLFTIGITGSSVFAPFGSAGDFILGSTEFVVLSLLGITFILIPVIILLYILICLVINHKTNRTALLIMFILWISVFIALPVSAIKYTAAFHNAPAPAARTVYHDVEGHERLMDSIDDCVEYLSLTETETEIKAETETGKSSDRRSETNKAAYGTHADQTQGGEKVNTGISIDED